MALRSSGSWAFCRLTALQVHAYPGKLGFHEGSGGFVADEIWYGQAEFSVRTDRESHASHVFPDKVYFKVLNLQLT